MNKIKDSIKQFETDGCSGGMSFIYTNVFKKELPWRGACVTHDLQYWVGGSKYDRKKADIDLLCDVSKNGHPIIGFLMYLAVRMGGGPFFPTSYRWGYGKTYPCKYGRRCANDKRLLALQKKKVKEGEVNDIS